MNFYSFKNPGHAFLLKSLWTMFLPLVFGFSFGLAFFSSRPLRAEINQSSPYKEKTQHHQTLEHHPPQTHPTLGSEHAPVTFEFFLNLANSQSAQAHQKIQRLAKRHPTRLRVIYRLINVRRSSHQPAQHLGIEAFRQGIFFPFLKLFFGPRLRPPSSREYSSIAAKAKMSFAPSILEESLVKTDDGHFGPEYLERVRQSIAMLDHEMVLNKNLLYWRKMLVPQVPGLLINGHRTAAVNSLEDLEALYDKAYEESMHLLSKGMQSKDIYQHLRRHGVREVQSTRSISGPFDHVEAGEESPPSPKRIDMQPLLKGGFQQGPDNAKVTMVFICHLQSHHCRTMYHSLDTLRSTYPKALRIIIQPLFDSGHPMQDHAQAMHEAAYCAGEQDTFDDYFNLIFDLQRKINFGQSDALELASSTRINLDIDRFRDCLKKERFAPQLQKEIESMRQAGVTHTPALAISGLLYTGRLHFEALQRLVEKELAPGLLETLSSP